MQALNLINPGHSTITYALNTFPDGEPHIKLNVESINTAEPCALVTRMSNPASFLLALYAHNALQLAGVQEVDLHVSFLTTGRMDRAMNPGEPFSLKVTADIINQQGFRNVFLFDPHSKVSTALIERSVAIGNVYFARDVFADILQRRPSLSVADISLVAPDAGALPKITAVADFLGGLDVVACEKRRDPATGALLSMAVQRDDLHGRTCFILDDILDGGGTFRGIAKILMEKGAKQIFVAASHGIFSKGFDFPEVEHFYTTNSFRDFPDAPANLMVLDVEKYLMGSGL